MKKILFNGIACITFMLLLQKASAFADSIPSTKTYRVGVFAPLYLDSVFSETGNFRYREGMPKLMTSALDFVNGVQVALDSMQGINDRIEMTVYDTKSFKKPLASLISNSKLDQLDLLIGSVKDSDYKQLANLAHVKNIPFISATYPNDGGITKNPFVVVVNSTLKAHCEAIYSFLLQNHGTHKLFLCRKKGQQDDKVAAYFKLINEQDGRLLLNIQTLNFDSSISPNFLKIKLDSNRQSVIIGASLDESFALNLATACNTLKDQYPLTLIGMPNWDAFKSLTKKGSLENFPIYFTSPYFNNKADSSSRQLLDVYTQKTKGKPSDVAFKGYEVARIFVKLLTLYPNDFMSHLNEKSLKVFSDYNFRPVMKKGSNVPDYFENKHLYFIKILNGSVVKAW